MSYLASPIITVLPTAQQVSNLGNSGDLSVGNLANAKAILWLLDVESPAAPTLDVNIQAKIGDNIVGFLYYEIGAWARVTAAPNWYTFKAISDAIVATAIRTATAPMNPANPAVLLTNHLPANTTLVVAWRQTTGDAIFGVYAVPIF